MNPQELTTQLKSVYEDKLESVILYGSAADGEFQKGRSDFNVIIVLKEASPVELSKCNGIMKKWGKDKNPLPLFFTPQRIAESIDVFPIEFYDIKERHKILHGTNPFKEIKIDPKNLRHQCEHEIRSKLLTIRGRFALLADKPKELINLMIESSSSFFAILGGVLRLAGQKPASDKKAMVEQLASIIDLNPAIFIEIIDVRIGNIIWRKEDALPKFEQYLTSLDAVVRYVDKF